MVKAWISLLVGLLFTVVLSYMNHVEVTHCSVASGSFSRDNITVPFSQNSMGRKTYTYRCNLESAFDHEARIGIAVDEILMSVAINGEPVELASLKERYGQQKLKDWSRGYSFVLPLQRGQNKLLITGKDNGGKFGLKVRSGLEFTDYFFLFAIGIVPMVYGGFMLLFPLFVRLLKKVRSPSVGFWSFLPYLIIAAGIAVRLLYVVYVPNSTYQHDMSGHIEAIHYYAEFPLDIPQADKSLQFPQQPLYYWISGALYAASTALEFNEHDAIYSIRVMSVAFASAWLVIGLLLVRLYTQRQVTVNLFMAFLAFTPSFVILGAAVNNDALNALLGMLVLYGAAAYWKRGRRFDLVLASAAVLLGMLTKISSVLFAVYLVTVLLALYFRATEAKSRYRNEILVFGLAVLFVFGFALVKAHIPSVGEFRFINSGLFSGQVIPTFDLDYFFSFHIIDLVKAGQAYVYGVDSVRFSLPTYLYGTLFTGEYSFEHYFKGGSPFKLMVQLMYISGLIYVIGLAGYMYRYNRLPLQHRLLAVPVMINLALIIKFLMDYWDVCNSDFRYFSPTFAAIGLMFVIGLEQWGLRYRWLRKIIVPLAVLLVFTEIYWSAKIIASS